MKHVYLVIFEFNSPGELLSKNAISWLIIDLNNMFLNIKENHQHYEYIYILAI